MVPRLTPLTAGFSSRKTAALCEVRYRLGICREKLGDDKGAIAIYALAASYSQKADTYRLSAIAHAAALNEKHKDYPAALAAYRDLIKNSTDPEIVVAAKERAHELLSGKPVQKSSQ